MAKKYILNLFLNEWGFNKTISILGLNLAAIDLTTVICINLIPNKSNNLKKEND